MTFMLDLHRPRSLLHLLLLLLPLLAFYALESAAASTPPPSSRSTPPPPNCVWSATPSFELSSSSSSPASSSPHPPLTPSSLAHRNDPRCAVYARDYPNCSLYQYADRTPIPCQGEVGGAASADRCRFTGNASAAPRPTPASWHVHVFFPNVNCTNCSAPFVAERPPRFTYNGAMELRALLSGKLNDLARVGRSGSDRASHASHASRARRTGRTGWRALPLPQDPIDVARAATDPAYNQCGDTYNIVAGAPANFHDAPCIFEADLVKKMGPFTDPRTLLGYPNYSFFIPGTTWAAGLFERFALFLEVRCAGRCVVGVGGGCVWWWCVCVCARALTSHTTATSA